MRAKILVPNAVTLLGAGAATLSMVWAGPHPYWACNALIASALCDMIDGRVARMLGVQSPFGEQLDSLVDVVAFGVAPAWLAWQFALGELGAVGPVPGGVLPMFVFVAASACRLALFNSSPQPEDASFRGIPTPVSALLLVTAIMAAQETGAPPFGEPLFVTSLLLVASLLMVAPVRFRSFKQFRSAAGRLVYFGSIGGGLLLLVLGLPGGTLLFFLLALYVLQGLVAAGMARARA